jgi:hypothetical protein
MIGAQSAITTPILFFAAYKQVHHEFSYEQHNVSATKSYVTTVIKFITLWKEFMPLESRYMDIHYGFCWIN